MAKTQELEKQVEYGGQKGRVRIICHPSGSTIAVEICVPMGEVLGPEFMEMSLYDAAHVIADQHAWVANMLRIKGDTWT